MKNIFFFKSRCALDITIYSVFTVFCMVESISFNCRCSSWYYFGSTNIIVWWNRIFYNCFINFDNFLERQYNWVHLNIVLKEIKLRKGLLSEILMGLVGQIYFGNYSRSTKNYIALFKKTLGFKLKASCITSTCLEYRRKI